jgi:7-cyano-7-deazaguanine synthase
MRRGGLILSGGPDSAVAAWDTLDPNNYHYTDPDDENTLWTAYHFQYGQLAIPELNCARAQAHLLGVGFVIITLPEGLLTSTMTERSIDRAADNLEPTFVPGRNAIFINLVASALYHRGNPMVIVGGWNAADAAGYPDCRPSFITAQAIALGQALDCKVQIVSPVINMMKSDIIAVGTDLGVPFEKTWSCYTPIYVKDPKRWLSCGKCVSCKLRAKGFELAKVTDPMIGAFDEVDHV